MTKHFILTGILFLGVFAEAKPKQDFECVNNMYREASFSLAGDLLRIKDSPLRGGEGLIEAVQEALGTNLDLLVHDVSLDISEAHKICSSSLTYLVDCNGQAKDAILHVEASVLGGKNFGGQLSLDFEVQVKNFSLKSKLASQGGPISIGNDPTTVSLDQLEVESTANLALNGRNIQLSWSPFFYTARDSGGSYCKRY